VRFHNILHGEIGVYDEDEHGAPIYDFSYVDQIYDGFLANGVRPFVEISFMPKKLALRQDVHPNLAQTDRFAAEGLRQVGRVDTGIHRVSGGWPRD
jgi:beta-xylosidase